MPNEPPPGGWDSDNDGVDDVHDLCPCVSGSIEHQGCPVGCEQSLRLAEWLVYGSASTGRVASVKPENIWRPAGAGQPIDTSNKYFTRVLDEKYYELKDHLGNVRVVVTDVKRPDQQSGQHPYVAVVASYNNYYPYGMMQPDRSYQPEGHRYGFNGKEMDNEVAVTGGSYDYGARMYDARVGRWMSIDPFASRYPSQTAFGFAMDNPVYFIDPDGGVVLPWYKVERRWTTGFFEERYYYDDFLTNESGRSWSRNLSALAGDVPLFYEAWRRIQQSRNVYRVEEFSYTDEDRNMNWELGYFEPNHQGTTRDPFILAFRYEPYGSTSAIQIAIFEEVWHAAEHDFSSTHGIPMSRLETEVSVRVARAFCGLTYGGYEQAFAEKPAVKAVFDAIRGGSPISQAAQEAFATEVRNLSNKVYDHYADIWSTAGIEIGALKEDFNTTKTLAMFFSLTKASLPDKPTIEGRGSAGAEADVSSGRRVGGR